MAGPRSRRGGQPVPQAPDLTDLADLKEMSEEMAVAGIIQAERHAGMRCMGCDQRITLGFKFTRFTPKYVEGAPTVVSQVRYSCDGRPLPQPELAKDAKRCGGDEAPVCVYAEGHDGDCITPEQWEADPPICDFAEKCRAAHVVEQIEFAWLKEPKPFPRPKRDGEGGAVLLGPDGKAEKSTNGDGPHVGPVGEGEEFPTMNGNGETPPDEAQPTPPPTAELQGDRTPEQEDAARDVARRAQRRPPSS